MKDNNKLYYTDPRHASIMMSAFGAKIYWQHDVDRKQVPQELSNLAHDIYHGSVWQGKYYIHPDSYHIFEPQVEDVIICDHRGEPAWIADIKKDWCSFDTGGGCNFTGVRKIIQRNDKPFFMPESEET